MAPESHFDSEFELRGYEALLQLADLMVHRHDVGELFPELTAKLHQVVVFELAGVSLHDPLKNTLSLRVWEGGPTGTTPRELPIEGTTAGWVWENQQPLAFADVQEESGFAAGFDILKKMGIRSFCELPLSTKQRRLGTLALGSSRPNLYGEKEMRLLRDVAQMMALSLENVMTRSALQQEKERLQTLLEINATLVSNLEIREVFPAISQSIHRVLKHDHASILLYDNSTQSFRKHAWVAAWADKGVLAEKLIPVKESPAGHAYLVMEPKVYSDDELLTGYNGAIQHLLSHGIRSLCCIPLLTGKGPLGTLNLGSRQDHAFQPQDINLLKQIASQLAVSVDNFRAQREVVQLRDKLAEEKRYLQGEISFHPEFRGNYRGEPGFAIGSA